MSSTAAECANSVAVVSTSSMSSVNSLNTMSDVMRARLSAAESASCWLAGGGGEGAVAAASAAAASAVAFASAIWYSSIIKSFLKIGILLTLAATKSAVLPPKKSVSVSTDKHAAPAFM